MELIKPLALILSFVGFCLTFGAHKEIGRFRAPFITCCAIALSLFFCGLLGVLKNGTLMICATGIALFAVQLWGRIRDRQVPVPTLSSLICCVPFIALFVSISPNFKFTLWDEFSFWASSTKIIYTTNALFEKDSPIFFKNYPPLQQLFHYYFLRFLGWSEKIVLYAQIFWILTGLLCVAGSLVSRSRFASLTFILSCSFLFYFGYSYASIYSDALLGVTFAACLSIALSVQRPLRYVQLVTFIISACALVLIKEIAVVFVAISVTVLIITLLMGSQHADIRDQSPKNSFGTFRDVSLALLATIVVIVGALKSWSWYVTSIDAARKIALPSLTDLLAPAWQSRIHQTLNEFTQRIFKSGYLQINEWFGQLRPSIFLILILLAAISFCYAIFADRTKRKLNLFNVSVIFAGALGYTVVLFVTYLIIFTEYEGVRLASFERYLSTYLLAWLLVVFGLWMGRISSCQRTAPALLLAAAITASILILAPKQFYKEMYAIRSDGPDQDLRVKIEDFAAGAKRHMNPKDKIYFIAQNSNGLERVMFYYAMLPYTSSMEWCWSVGKKYSPSDVWTCDTQLSELIKNFSHLALYRGDNQFWSHSRTLFAPGSTDINSGIFKIQQSPARTIEKIERVQ
jgi:hypothetical protein